MTDQDKRQFIARLTGLLEVLGGELSPDGFELYYRALADVPWPALERAFNAALAGCKFLPKPVELRDLALGTHGDAIERSWQAWKAAAAKYGAWWSVLFEDGAIARTILAIWGSWVNACLAEHSPEMWASKRKEWERVYPLQTHDPMCLHGQIALCNRASRGAMTRGNEPPERIALVAPSGAMDVKALPPGSDPLALLGGTVPALPPADQEPDPAEATDVLTRLKTELAARGKTMPPAPEPVELSEEQYRERVEVLRRQAAEIQGESA